MTASELFTSLKRQVECGEFIEIDDEQYFDGYRPMSADRTLRILVERAIIRRAVADILAVQAEGGPAYTVSVWDGEEYAAEKCGDLGEIMAQIGACDEEWLVVRRAGTGQLVGEIFLVYGNDGWDVIADNSLPLKWVLDGATKLAFELTDLMAEDIQ